MEVFVQILLLLAVTILIVVGFQRLHAPTSLAYLLVGVILGPYTIGPTIVLAEFDAISEFGVVFLLFTIGLNYSLPQLRMLRGQVLTLGSGQVVFTTLFVTLLLWLSGLTPAVAFVFGAVFAQSSTTIMSSLLSESGETNTQHGRFGLAMSVFQDVTAVPFLVLIPLLGTALALDTLMLNLGWAMLKVICAFALVILLGKWLLRPLFHLVSQKRSSEIFTLTVLLVALLAAWTTDSLGLSLAFGGFLAGMILGETEFRHQVESSIRPFRDVLLGLFFIAIGMRFDPFALPPIWHWALLGALVIIGSKIVIVFLLLRKNATPKVALQTGLLLAVGGEFGLALVAIAMDSMVINAELSQIAITAVLLSMVIGAILIRFNQQIAALFFKDIHNGAYDSPDFSDTPTPQVVIGGYGRVGHTIAVLLESRGIPYIAFDNDPHRVQFGREQEKHAVYYGEISDHELLDAIHIQQVALVIITVDGHDVVWSTLKLLRQLCPQVPVIARARDLESSIRLRDAGAVKAYPETIESSLHLGQTALQILGVPDTEIDTLIQGVRDRGYITVLNDNELNETHQ
ncbi:cation:proton antiporter [Vibrio cholerae]|uniref:cation:proton antiporter domain-containing protein n=1 Tax=Vibrio paracholerae TaxID=650003 RepID=UPI000DE4A496|nr:cation:proton antiporter [Vibrio paracholerae]ELJ8546251.1 cation:proton antiporter [Vibrio cholerae]ELY5188365.1 cation:proton antiporter [Vibrio cholerae]ELY5286653.1 cation:proton antiporter [Vibrio cholerae]RBM81308.1 sodium:proton exchanger [Vibrio paracholerae]